MGKIAVLAFTLVGLAHSAGLVDDLIASELVDQARQWQQKNRDDLAAELWRKLLRANPKHPEALVKLGVIEARAGNLRAAEALYSRAIQLDKPPVGLNQLSAALDAGKRNPADLARPLPNPNLRPEPEPEPEPSKRLPLKAEASQPAPTESVEPVAKARPSKPLAPKADAATPVASEQKAQTPAASASPKTSVKEKPAQATEADRLNLKFSNSMGVAR
jgi:outer membrane biosynthesis protein TonB